MHLSIITALRCVSELSPSMKLNVAAAAGESDTQAPGLSSMVHGPQPSRQWTPIDNHNEKFLLAIEKRERQQGSGIMKDYHQDNLVSAKILETKESEHQWNQSEFTL